MTMELIKKVSIEECCAHRNRSIELIDQAISFVEKANETALKAAPTAGSTKAFVGVFSERGKMDPSLEDYRKGIDKACWCNLLNISGLQKLMSASQREKFKDALYKNPPEFTVQNVYATFADKITNAGAIFDQSVIDVFERLPADYKTNNRFRFDNKIIFNAGYSCVHHDWYSTITGRYDIQAMVDDLDRIMHILDHKKHDTDATALCTLAMREGKTTCETAYFKFQWFKKGSVHIYFLRDDLVQEMNHILAKHYGNAIANTQ